MPIVCSVTNVALLILINYQYDQYINYEIEYSTVHLISYSVPLQHAIDLVNDTKFKLFDLQNIIMIKIFITEEIKKRNKKGKEKRNDI